MAVRPMDWKNVQYDSLLGDQHTSFTVDSSHFNDECWCVASWEFRIENDSPRKDGRTLKILVGMANYGVQSGWENPGSPSESPGWLFTPAVSPWYIDQSIPLEQANDSIKSAKLRRQEEERSG